MTHIAGRTCAGRVGHTGLSARAVAVGGVTSLPVDASSSAEHADIKAQSPREPSFTEPVSLFASGFWASSSWLVTRRAFRRFSFKKTRGWGASRRRGRCCTSFDRVFQPFRRRFWRATSRPTRPTSADIAEDGTDVERARLGWPSLSSDGAAPPVVFVSS